MAFKIVNLAVAGLVSSIFLYSSYYFYSYKRKKKDLNAKAFYKSSLEYSKNENHDYNETANNSCDLYSLNAKTTDGGTLTATEVESLLSKLDITDVKLLERILITISNLASFSCNHALLNDFGASEKLFDCIKNEWVKLLEIYEDTSFILHKEKTSKPNTIINQCFVALSNLVLDEILLPNFEDLIVLCEQIIVTFDAFAITEKCKHFLLNASAAHGKEECFASILQRLFLLNFRDIKTTTISETRLNSLILNMKIVNNLCSHFHHAEDIFFKIIPYEIRDKDHLQNHHNEYVLRYLTLMRSLLKVIDRDSIEKDKFYKYHDNEDYKQCMAYFLTSYYLKRQIDYFEENLMSEYDERVIEVFKEVKELFPIPPPSKLFRIMEP